MSQLKLSLWTQQTVLLLKVELTQFSPEKMKEDFHFIFKPPFSILVHCSPNCIFLGYEF